MADQPGRIVVAGLSKSFGTVRAVDNLSFTVEPGSVTGFLGPNGAGKTTTLRMLLGLVTPDRAAPRRSAGVRTTTSRTRCGRSARCSRRRASTPAAPPATTCGCYAAASGIPDQPGRRGAGPGRPHRRGQAQGTHGYSLGMRQRLGLAFALLGNPRVLLLDEPANGLDPEGIRWLRGFLRALADEGRTVLVSSHLLTEVQQSADRVVILSQGRLVREGSVVELEQGAGVTVVVRSPTPDQLGDALAAAGVTATRSGPDAAAGARAATPPRSGTPRSRPASSCTSCAPSGPTWSSCSSS